jgi:spore germination protein
MRLRFRQGPVSLILLVMLGVGAWVLSSGIASAAQGPKAQTQNQIDVRWGFYITYNPNSWVSLQANASNLNYVSPWFYNVEASGQVSGRDRTEVTTLLRQVKVKSLPMLKNVPTYDSFTAILTDTNKQVSLVNQIDVLVRDYDYAGITIDFEGLNATDKQALTDFMARLYARLHPKGKLVAMAVPSKTRDTNTGWAGAYDYASLAAVTDFLLIMAYDFHWVNSAPGPIAPIDKLRATAGYTLARVPAGKVIWGVGVYGYDWGKDAEGKPDGKTAEYRNHGEATGLARSTGAQSGYDPQAEAPWVRYTRDGLERELWYENRRSFDAKLDLIREFGMAGFGIWRLGQEDPAIWESIQDTRQPLACLAVDPPGASTGKLYFPETGHSLGGAFLKYWRTNGGLPIYGYPLTEEFIETSPTNGKQYTVQYFERNRFEYHPENQPPNDVLLGLLGVQVTGQRVFPPADNPATGIDTVFFPQVLHTLSNPFLGYWQKYGGLAQFGYPISEPVLERSATDGQTYTVQYMERARFEYHPEYTGTDAEVLLGLLGRDILPCR